MKKKIYIVFGFVLIVLGMIFIVPKTEEEHKYIGEITNIEKDFDTIPNDKLAFTIDGQDGTGTFPTKGGSYKGQSVTCSNNATGVWNNDTWQLEISNMTAGTSCVVNFVKYTPTLAEKILIDNPNVSTSRGSFSSAFTTSNNGNTIYRASGEAGMYTYYFAGSVSNNYVQLGSSTDRWRIVRINEDGSVRMIFQAGVIANYPTTSIFSSSSGYTDFENSQAKTNLETWYTSVLSSYDNYISKTAIYCEDKAVADSGQYGYVFRNSVFAPSFNCIQDGDKYTVSTTTGNGKLTKPIGLITADEVVYAGAPMSGSENKSYYLYHNLQTNSYWTMTPYSVTNQTYVNTSGIIANASEMAAYAALRPVISLKACVKWASGNGTSGSPYKVSITSDCASAENSVIGTEKYTVALATNNTSAVTIKSPASTTVNKGSNYALEYKLEDGYRVTSITGCDGYVHTQGNGASYFTNVTDYHSTIAFNNIQSNKLCILNVEEYIESPKNYTAPGAYTYTIPKTGRYKLEVWGAQGGSYSTSKGIGGKGGYSYGEAEFTKGDILYIKVGGQGTGGTTAGTKAGGYNGGGSAYSKTGYYAGSGGGATDIRVNTDSLNNRIIVAGGGGGFNSYTTQSLQNGGLAGGSEGNPGSTATTSYMAGTGGTATSIGISYAVTTALNSGNSYGTIASFGYGASWTSSSAPYGGAGGGGGWYGGGMALRAGGGGGSSFVYNGTTPTMPSGQTYGVAYKYKMIPNGKANGAVDFLSPSGTIEVGHAGNGYARITYLDASSETTTTSYTVAVASSDTSLGTVSPASQSVSPGGTATITLTPKSGAAYKSNTCGGTVNGNTLTISNVTSDISCTVTFESTTYYSWNKSNIAYGSYLYDTCSNSGTISTVGPMFGYNSYKVNTSAGVFYNDSGGQIGPTTINTSFWVFGNSGKTLYQYTLTSVSGSGDISEKTYYYSYCTKGIITESAGTSVGTVCSSNQNAYPMLNSQNGYYYSYAGTTTTCSE